MLACFRMHRRFFVVISLCVSFVSSMNFFRHERSEILNVHVDACMRAHAFRMRMQTVAFAAYFSGIFSHVHACMHGMHSLLSSMRVHAHACMHDYMHTRLHAYTIACIHDCMHTMSAHVGAVCPPEARDQGERLPRLTSM